MGGHPAQRVPGHADADGGVDVAGERVARRVVEREGPGDDLGDVHRLVAVVDVLDVALGTGRGGGEHRRGNDEAGLGQGTDQRRVALRVTAQAMAELADGEDPVRDGGVGDGIAAGGAGGGVEDPGDRAAVAAAPGVLAARRWRTARSARPTERWRRHVPDRHRAGTHPLRRLRPCSGPTSISGWNAVSSTRGTPQVTRVGEAWAVRPRGRSGGRGGDLRSGCPGRLAALWVMVVRTCQVCCRAARLEDHPHGDPVSSGARQPGARGEILSRNDRWCTCGRAMACGTGTSQDGQKSSISRTMTDVSDVYG